VKCWTVIAENQTDKTDGWYGCMAIWLNGLKIFNSHETI
jgi:hypothetical protein